MRYENMESEVKSEGGRYFSRHFAPLVQTMRYPVLLVQSKRYPGRRTGMESPISDFARLPENECCYFLSSIRIFKKLMDHGRVSIKHNN
jgi:hypothetical protein